MNNQAQIDQLALEYVLGTLSEEERAQVETLRLSDQQLNGAIVFWESSMTPAVDTLTAIPPSPKVLDSIMHRIDPLTNSANSSNQTVSIWDRILTWKLATVFSFAMLLITVGLIHQNGLSNQTFDLTLNAGYVAVLEDDKESPVLTAIAASDGSRVWFKWENWQANTDTSIQLWAKSRRDGQIRPLALFDETEVNEIALDQAKWRLIKDSSHLIMTKEAKGGSAIDEPSQHILATGACIRLKQKADNV